MTEIIELYGHSYKYSFIGEEIREPNPSDVDLTYQDIADYQSYITEKNNYNQKVEKLVDNFTIWLSLLLYIFVIIFFVFYMKERINLFDNGIKGTVLSLMTICFLAAVLGEFFVFIPAMIFNMILPTKLRKAIVIRFIKAPQEFSKIERAEKYVKLVEDYNGEKRDYIIKYRNIENFDYSVAKYGKAKVAELTDKIIEFVKKQNEEIEKKNRRLEQSYWENLDPYEFEEEVANWFIDKGYKAEITKKSCDEGIDIIISKPGYKGYVQCKRYTQNKVDRPTLNQLYGVVKADNVSQGVIACLLGLTKEALDFAKKTRMMIVTLDDLAPANSLFYHISPLPKLQENPIANNDYWIKVGDFMLNTTVYQNEENALKNISKWNTPEKYHILEYCSLFFIMYCTNEIYENFKKDLIKKPIYNYQYSNHSKKGKRRNYYY